MPDPALADTDVASVLYRARLFRRVVPAGLVDVVADRPLVISVVTLGEASYGALSRKWSPRRTTEMLAFHADSFGFIELGRTVRSSMAGSARQRRRSAGRSRATTCGSPHRRRPTGCS